MKIACLCPTYRRPFCLQNALACFLMQTHADRELIILDDAGQYASQQGDGWRLVSVPHRFRTLGEKFNACAALASPDVEAYCVWEDDDVYLPWHVESHAAALKECGFSAPRRVMDQLGEPGWRVRENEGCLFHASWGFTRAAFEAIRGYPITAALNFDQQLQYRLREACGIPSNPTRDFQPAYLYRWGASNAYNGSAFGEGWYEHTATLKNLPGDDLGTIARVVPAMDNLTRLLYRDWGRNPYEPAGMAD